jgi:hypothetical protein
MTDREWIETAATVAAMLTYEPNSGLFVWKIKDASWPDFKRWNARYAGKTAGHVDPRGYIHIGVKMLKRHKILAHKLAWFVVTGTSPAGEIDHINQNTSDNRIVNLRDVTKSENQRNATLKKTNTSGTVGVTWHAQRKKWQAQAGISGRHQYLGLFSDKQEAEKVAREFRDRNGFTQNHGRAAAAMVPE